MNVTSLITVAYENKSNWTLGENEPKTNPIKPNFKKAQMNVNSLITKDYRKNDDFAVPKNKANSNPISKQLQGGPMIAIVPKTKDRSVSMFISRFVSSGGHETGHGH